MLHAPQATCSTQRPQTLLPGLPPHPHHPPRAGRQQTNRPPRAARSTPATPNIVLGSKHPNSSMQTRVRFWGKSGKQHRRQPWGTLDSTGSDKKTGQERNQPNPPSQSLDSQQIRAENGPVTPTRNARNAQRVALTGRSPPFPPRSRSHRWLRSAQTKQTQDGRRRSRTRLGRRRLVLYCVFTGNRFLLKPG